MQLKEVYGEVFRVLKPGAKFASYEWVSTAQYDPNNAEHVRIIDEINFGNGLPVSCPSYTVTLESLAGCSCLLAFQRLESDKCATSYRK